MRVAIGLSGGVDSSVAAMLLKRAGHDVVGVSMNLWSPTRFPNREFEACFGPGAIRAMEEASRLAKFLGISFHVFDGADLFDQKVLEKFKSDREAGLTPNPCVVCNRYLKFGWLPTIAREKLGCEAFATGHYARVANRESRLALARAKHFAKDQSYFLWSLSQEQLANVIFPLGELTKNEVRDLAREAKLAMAEKADSQDFYSGNSDDLISLTPRDGEIVDLSGKVLAIHQGYWHFTVGQRKGLGFATGTPMYVIAIDSRQNRVIVGTRDDAVRREFKIDVATLNWVAIKETNEPITCRVKVRSAGEPVGPVVYRDGVVTASGGVFGVAPGQSAVFYDLNSDDILFGAVIQESGI